MRETLMYIKMSTSLNFFHAFIRFLLNPWSADPSMWINGWSFSAIGIVLGFLHSTLAFGIAGKYLLNAGFRTIKITGL